MEEFIKTHIEPLKDGTPHNDYCVNSAMAHMEIAREALTAREEDPKQYYTDAIKHAKWVMKVTPILHIITENMTK
tara:strand:- start:273 stop:497 length:225 start_codon:yes stop_codon:yes gene_type:complete